MLSKRKTQTPQPAPAARPTANHTTKPAGLTAVPPKSEFDLGPLLENRIGQRAFAILSEMFQDLSEGDLELLATFAKILSRNTGMTSPAEEFIWGVVLMYGVRDGNGRGMTPEDIEDDLKMFRENFERMIENHAFICGRYAAEIHASEKAEPQIA
jgi:hypothetical protein